MALVTINDANLTAIAEAIRGKNGTTDTYTPSQMPAAIDAIETGGGGGIDTVLTGFKQSYFIGDANAGKMADRSSAEPLSTWALNNLSFTTQDLYSMCYGFMNQAKIKSINFPLNFKPIANSSYVSNGVNIPLTSLFSGCEQLESAPAINFSNGKFGGLGGSIFRGCNNLRTLPQLTITNCEMIDGYGVQDSMRFYECYSLKEIPPEWLTTTFTGLGVTESYFGTYSLYNYMCYKCYALGEVTNIPVLTVPVTTAVTYNGLFYYSFNTCSRLKELTFEPNQTAQWTSQTLDLSSSVGYSSGDASNITSYNSGLTVDTRVSNDTEYQALKDNPDWWTTALAYSRYNHDSAVNTINSLPDCSAYLTETSGTANTIKFKGTSGSSTDGGAINTLTEEEIAVAAAKGWTVTLV